MAYFKKNGVKFDGINLDSLTISKKLAASNYEIDGSYNIISEPSKIINAIDIDWNNAIVENSNNEPIVGPIKTTADLINTISNIKSSINTEKPQLSYTDLIDGDSLLTKSYLTEHSDEFKGESAFDIAKRIAQANNIYFPYQNESEWIASLKGVAGQNGKSAYEIAKNNASNPSEFQEMYPNENAWIQSITNATEAKSYTDNKFNELNGKILSSETIQQLIDTSVDKIVGEDVSENFDTLKEISDWIVAHPELQEFTDLSNKVNSIIGNLTETYTDPETNVTTEIIKKFEEGDLNGLNWATSIEELNEIIARVSFAEGVQDGAEPNKIDEVNFAIQDFSALTGDTEGDKEVQFGSAVLGGENNKLVGISIDTALLSKIQEHTLSLAQGKADTAENNAKTYVDEKLSWTIVE